MSTAEAALPDTNLYAAPDAELTRAVDAADQPPILSYRGRMGRLTYLAWMMLAMIAMVPVLGVAAVLGLSLAGEEGGLASGATALSLLLFAPITVFASMLSAKRLHDINHTGWLQLLTWIPFLGALFALYMMVRPGQPGDNRFGAPRHTRAWEKVVAGLIVVLMVIALIFGVIATLGAIFTNR